MRVLPLRSARDRRREDPIAATLDALPDAVALHDRRLTSRSGRPAGDILDHLVVASAGVWVIDAKTHYGPVEIRRSGGILTPLVERLFINNRDRTDLVESLQRQLQSVERVLAEDGHGVAVRGALCLLGTELPWVTEQIAGVPVVGRRDLTKLGQHDGDLDAPARTTIAAALDARFIPA